MPARLSHSPCLVGRETLEQLALVEKELNAKRPFSILTVTILTSFNEKTLPPLFNDRSLSQHVSALADLALASGSLGLVCSPHEVNDLRKKSSDAFLVVPGVRMPGDKSRRSKTHRNSRGGDSPRRLRTRGRTPHLRSKRPSRRDRSHS